MVLSLVGEQETATEERAMSERSISLEWCHHHNHKDKRRGSRKRQHIPPLLFKAILRTLRAFSRSSSVMLLARRITAGFFGCCCESAGMKKRDVSAMCSAGERNLHVIK